MGNIFTSRVKADNISIETEIKTTSSIIARKNKAKLTMLLQPSYNNPRCNPTYNEARWRAVYTIIYHGSALNIGNHKLFQLPSYSLFVVSSCYL